MAILYRTEKTAAGFQFQVYSVEHGKPSKILRDGICATRQQATARAKHWAKFLTEAHKNFDARYAA